MKRSRSITYRLVMALALACALGGLAIPSLALVHRQTAVVAAEQQVQHFSVSGIVEAVNYDANSVKINSGGKHVEIVIEPSTAIDDRGQVGSISDIHRGRRIVASGVVRGGVMVAQSVRLR